MVRTEPTKEPIAQPWVGSRATLVSMSTLDSARVAFEDRVWTRARDLLTAADTETELAPDDLLMLGTAAQLCGDDKTSDAARQRVFHRCRDRGDTEVAARAAFFLGLNMMNRGDPAQGGAWIGRAVELMENVDHECPEQGYVMVPMALRALGSGNEAEALKIFTHVLETGDRFGDEDLRTLGQLGVGQSLLQLGQISEGLAGFDRAMVSVVTGEVSALIAGIVYCAVVEGCHDIGDLARSREWTRALSAWCDSQPDLVPFRGRCLVHRSEIMQLDGDWVGAREEATRACARLADPPGQPPLGAALYQLAELQRLGGDLDAATDTYRRASEYGRDPQPGLALLRMTRGDPEAADATLARVLDEGGLSAQRPGLLAARVEVAIAAGHLEAARATADELTATTADAAALSLIALAATARGRLALEEGEPRGALGELRHAAHAWGELGAVYETARVRELIAEACRRVGDLDTADLELGTARATYERLGAKLDLARVDASDPAGPEPDHGAGLTGREVEVLKHVATGQTNRQIADALIISEKTVARHVSNIFTKLDVGSRTAAAAYAHEHDLV